MFITVKFGADDQIILNPNSKVVNLVESLRERSQCGPEVSLDLLDESGNLVNLSDLEGSQDIATNYLKERHCYVLVKIIRGGGSEPVRYESMLENLGKRHPELAERLQKLSRPNMRGRNSVIKKSRPIKETIPSTSTKSRTVSQQKSRLS
ncbi:hypothetical protein XENTR_v10002375 [Xenopus tropicalis]|uniref:Uncharacterized protein C22orf15 homolog n=1 Tax=Xenopus tropicalis TaxID=8364 RepID=A0A8J0QIR3_XENTR|nr:uncharacterized protein C22orf15 homolog [Xenopus tropicalis]KAE8634640.1 hypothetical protein XENTR_v10002375 [Xenopus tropicalis]